MPCLCACFWDYSGKTREDAEYIVEKIHECSSGTNPHVECNYSLGSVTVCRDAYFQFLGLPSKSTRALSYETMVRQGISALPPRKNPEKIYGDGKQDVCRQWIHAFCVVHSEKSPSHPIFVILYRFRNNKVHVSK